MLFCEFPQYVLTLQQIIFASAERPASSSVAIGSLRPSALKVNLFENSLKAM